MTGLRARTQFLVLLTHTVLVQTVTFVVRPTVSYRALQLEVPPEWLVLGLGVGLVLLATAGLLVIGHSVAMLVTGSVFLGLGQLLSMIGEQSLVAGSAGTRGFDEAFGRFTFATSIGQAAGPALVTAFAGSATLAEAAPPDVRATALSLRLTGNRLGQTLVPAVVGLLASGRNWPPLGSMGRSIVANRPAATPASCDMTRGSPFLRC